MSVIHHQYQDILKAYNVNDRQMKYLKQFSQPIVERAQDYFIAIDRFNLQMTSIPIFIYKTSKSIDPITGVVTNVDDQYSVEISYNGIYSGQTFLQYVPQLGVTTASAFYYYVYSYNNFIRMINTALVTAFTTLGGLVTLPTGSLAPYFELDLKTNMMSFVVQNNFFNGTPLWGGVINVYMNNKMLRFVNGIPLSISTAAPNGRNLLLNVYNIYNNLFARIPVDKTPPDPSIYDFLVMYSEYGSQTLINWNDAKGLVFTTDTIPINPEYMPSAENDSSIVSRGILANFDFIYTESTPRPLNAQYIQQSPYKLIDLLGISPISMLDITVYWYDYNNNLYDCYLYDGEAMSIRLLFTRKVK
jgi:hypothetical protein